MNSQRQFGAGRSTRRTLHLSLVLASSLLLLSRARTARADVSSWAFIGAGATQLHQETLSTRGVAAMRVQFGLGSSPANPFVVGGLFSWEPNFGYGSDLALLVRGATRGYVNGDFGLALDVGPYERFWGQHSVGGAGTLWLGMPWGIGLGVGGSVGSHEERGLSAILGVDFARLTVYRNSGTSWFLNPFPAYRPES
ncbi:MAG: hypothetical protein ABJB12_14905 [Pseudomonadota bacterium]